jgi:signal transduction histidine kinase
MSLDRILIVDTNSNQRERLATALELGGYDTSTVADLSNLCDVVTESGTAVVVCATECGTDSLKRALADCSTRCPDVEFILIASNEDLVALTELYDAGNVFNHLWAPLADVGDLARTIGRALERRALRRQNARLLTELRDTRHELHSQADFLVQVEKLASLGKLVEQMARDLESGLTATELAARQTERLVICGELSAAQRLLQRVADEASVCRNTVRGALDFAVRSDPEFAPVDVARIARESLSLWEGRARRQGIRFVETLPVQAYVEACPGMLRQLLSHLISNAVDAMPQGGTLTVSGDLRELQGLHLQIADTGEGIDPNILPRIFEPFFTTRPMSVGTGLGLPICRDIVREHEGSILIESTPGEGTVVTVDLPAVRRAPQPTAVSAVPVQNAAENQPRDLALAA